MTAALQDHTSHYHQEHEEHEGPRLENLCFEALSWARDEELHQPGGGEPEVTEGYVGVGGEELAHNLVFHVVVHGGGGGGDEEQRLSVEQLSGTN